MTDKLHVAFTPEEAGAIIGALRVQTAIARHAQIEDPELAKKYGINPAALQRELAVSDAIVANLSMMLRVLGHRVAEF